MGLDEKNNQNGHTSGEQREKDCESSGALCFVRVHWNPLRRPTAGRSASIMRLSQSEIGVAVPGRVSRVVAGPRFFCLELSAVVPGTGTAGSL